MKGSSHVESSALYGDYLLAALASLPDDAPAVLFARHAERYTIDNVASPDDVPLTPAGEESARAFGARLPIERSIWLFHSPITRCRTTAELIAEGFAAAGGQVTFGGALEGLCRCYLLDRHGMNALVRQYGGGGSYKLIRDWFDGRFEPAIIDPCPVAAEKLRRLAENAAAYAGPGSLTILVTHDWEILTLREAFLGARHEDVGLVDYLDGLALAPAGDTTHFRWREFTAQLGTVPATGNQRLSPS